MNINLIYRNSFFCCEIIESFMTTYKKPISTKQLLILIPIVFDGNCRSRLNSVNSKGTIYSTFKDKKYKLSNGKNVNYCSDLSIAISNKDYIDNFILKAIILLSNSNKIRITSNGYIVAIDCKISYKKTNIITEKEFLKAAFMLGTIMSKCSFKDLLNLAGLGEE